MAKNLSLIVDAEGIATLTFDVPERSMNVLSAAVLAACSSVAKVSDVLAGKGDLIDGLKLELDHQAGRQVLRKENEAQSKTVTIMGNKDSPYQLLRKVMFTAARANFSDVSFAVRRMDM